jgi:surface carbohydrate biosynthesis protein
MAEPFSPILYLTTEVHNRDWDARLLMADYATSKGFAVLVGQQWSPLPNLKVIPKGMVLIKTPNQIQTDQMAGFRRCGHLVAAMDEESLAIAPDQDFVFALSPHLADSCDLFFANSPMHAQLMLEKAPALAPKLRTVGNPRLDLVVDGGKARFQAEADAIRAKYGRFILFNSNMANQNSIWTSQEQYLQIQVRTGAVNPKDPQSVRIFEEQFEFEAANSRAFLDLLRWCIANVRTHQIVIRPHPVEVAEAWSSYAADERVHVVLNTHHLPWIMAADLLVHTNSTTGVEAALLGTPTVNLVPLPDCHWSKIFIPRRINPTYQSWEEAASDISAYANAGVGPLADREAYRREIDRYFPNLTEARASERMVDCMIGALRERGVSPFQDSLAGSFAAGYKRGERADVLKRKFVKSLQDAAQDLKATRRASGLGHTVSLTEIDDSLFLIEPKLTTAAG